MKTRTLFRIFLILIVIFLAVLAMRSILRPEKFKSVYESRKVEIANRLMTIRTIQAVYKNEHKTYASHIDTLVDFVENGSISIIKNVGEIPEGMTEAEAFKAGLLKKEMVRVPAKERILEADSKLDLEALKKFATIPENNGKKFEIQIGSIKSKTYEIPVYRIDVSLDEILANMDRNITPENSNFFVKLINPLFYNNLANEEQYRIQYQPIWMGSLTEAVTTGSWE